MPEAKKRGSVLQSGARRFRVLSVHSRYRIRGGEDEVFDAECQLLRERGHDVVKLEFGPGEDGLLNSVSQGLSSIYSTSAVKDVARHLAQSGFDLLHVHNDFPLVSLGVHSVARRYGVPSVQHLHNYRNVCLSASLFRDGETCEQCIGRMIPFPGVRHRCYRGSALASAVIAMRNAAHLTIGTLRHKNVYAIAISNHVREKNKNVFLDDHIFMKPNFTYSLVSSSLAAERNYYLYAGRITKEKGVPDLINLWAQHPEYPELIIAGEGLNVPVGDTLPTNVKACGRVDLHEVQRVMQGAIATIIPSKWPEPFGRTAIESFATGTPVIATSVGGLQDIVDSATGILYAPEAPDGLRNAVEHMNAMRQSQTYAEMSAAASLKWKNSYSPESNIVQLENIYSKISPGRDD